MSSLIHLVVVFNLIALLLRTLTALNTSVGKGLYLNAEVVSCL